MTVILGLDLGTNSIGWAVIEKIGRKFYLKDKGVRLFQEGVKIEKGRESSRAAERTGYRSARRIKFRRKLRKIETLKVLSKFGFCPELSAEELNNWRYKKIYPQNDSFRNWQRTGDQTKNPYYFRNLAVTKQLNLENRAGRFKIGRALYHMAQRRGFLSNRLDSTIEIDGKVKQGISEISEAKGDKTLGQYFYQKYLKGEKIRHHYTDRKEHYLQEFQRICEVQQLPDEFIAAVHKAIFYQRPLKSQKGLVGKCVFEPKKPRCAVSRPEFEEYRMLSFVNNIKIQTPDDDKLRFLTDVEREKIMPLFFRKSKEQFDFEDIAKNLAPKKRYRFYRDTRAPGDYIFNFHMKTTVSGCPVSAQLKALFGEEFMEIRFEYTRERDNKPSCIDIHDIWHVLNTFDSNNRLADFVGKRLDLDDEQTEKFCKIKLKRDYASLSLKAINKILPWLRQGLIYSHAVFLANMKSVIPAEIWEKEENRKRILEKIHDIILRQNEEKQIIEAVNRIIKSYRDSGNKWSPGQENYLRVEFIERLKKLVGENSYNDFDEEKRDRLRNRGITILQEQMRKNRGLGEFVKVQRIDERVKAWINGMFGVESETLERLYHPSALEVFKASRRGDDGRLYLNSPLVPSVRNPMAMRALHQLRRVINELIKNDLVDGNTRVHIEMARDLKNANERKALQFWQRDREGKRAEYAKRIKEHFDAVGISREPEDDEILKYQLWEEQKHICLYTGKQIGLADFLGAAPKYDIEHTIPRSMSLDNSQENKTLCESRFNRQVKRNKIPAELNEHAGILARIEPWKERYEKLDRNIEKARRASRSAQDKEAKDRAIQKRHRLTFERNYWRSKYQRFKMQDVPAGFTNSQLVDTGIITKYSRMYLNTLFSKVYTVKGRVVADFRKMWGLQDNYAKKERVNHIHHCIDAVTIACITKENYERLAEFYHDQEDAFVQGIKNKPSARKPWPTFTEDIKELEREVLVSHYSSDVLAKQSKKKLRIRGRVQKDKNGNPICQQGDTVRGSLHKDTFYGAIERPVANKKGEVEKQIRYVVRKPLDSLEAKDVKHIVDDRVREIVANGKKQEKGLRSKLASLKKQFENSDKGEQTLIEEQVNELENKIQNLYAMPNKNGSPVPIKKVRIYQPMITNPLHIKKQRDVAKKRPKPYKEDYHVANDRNYAMAIYEGKNKKGKIVRDFHLVNTLDAGKYFKLSSKERKGKSIFPKTKKVGDQTVDVKGVVKVGTMVILWDTNPDEVWELDACMQLKRLYKVIGLSTNRVKSGSKYYEYGNITLKFHQEAKPDSELKVEDGIFQSDESYKAQRKLSHKQFNALIEGVDFELSVTGKLKRIA